MKSRCAVLTLVPLALLACGDGSIGGQAVIDAAGPGPDAGWPTPVDGGPAPSTPDTLPPAPPPPPPAPPPEPTCQAGKPCWLLVVDKTRYPSIAAELHRFVEDVRPRFSVSFALDNDAPYESWTAKQLRDLLKARHASDKIVGVILIGRLPFGLWEHDWDGEHRGVNSFYYEDLDGTFSDTDGDGHADLHEWGAQPGPEIFVSWLYPSTASADAELKAFFDKTHAYYTGQLVPRERGLVFIHSDWARDMDDFQDYFGQLAAIYGPTNVDRRGGYGGDQQPIEVDGDDYLQLIKAGYEISVHYTHANASGHYPDSNPVSRQEIEATPAGSLITFIGGCHSGDVLESGNQLNIATTYVFKTPLGLASTGTTWSYGPEELAQVTSRLAKGQSLGEAWLAKQKYRNTPSHYDKAYGHESAFDHRKHMYGEIFFGNPFIRVE